MIREKDKCFELTTHRTTYAFRIRENGLLEHLYYGRKTDLLCDDIQAGEQIQAIARKSAFAPGNAICYDNEDKSFAPEAFAFEFATSGKGDILEPMIGLTGPAGERTFDFVYESHEIRSGKQELKTLPVSYDESGKVQQLKVILREKYLGLRLEMYYSVFEQCDVITRNAVLVNESSKVINVNRFLSFLVDLEGDDYRARFFTGAWAREMHGNCVQLGGGRLVLSSNTGTSSSRINPFFWLEKDNTCEDFGECIGFNLIYSGNHYESMEVSPYGKTRVVAGINPAGFSWKLDPGEVLEAPEAVMTFSDMGHAKMSYNLHMFVREHIVRGGWKHKDRPILLNSWEAFYFRFNEAGLLKLAQTEKQVGIELFVLDDGWFGERDDDTASLGDWTENRKKLPNGLGGLAKKIKKIGMDFGIWVEPEMVNVNSNLYREHPEWVLEIKDRAHSEGRNQRILDLGNPLVQDYIIGEMSRVFSSAEISYVKWDMNRIVSDAFSQILEPERQGEVLHRYQIGLYRCMKELTSRFPEILFEGCSSGGNRFDLGILCYFPQIWASDNTDALCRAEIQNGYSYGYPQSVISAHVSSCPNHQTLRVTPLETRFAVAAFGLLGYECNLADLKKEELDAIKEQIMIYKKWRHTLQFGRWMRGHGFDGMGITNGGGSVIRSTAGNLQDWICVADDACCAVVVLLQRLAQPNDHSIRLRAKGLDPEKMYHFYGREMKYNVKGFGDLVNTVAPIHIRQDSMMHDLVARFVKLDGEKEDYHLRGDVLMNCGIYLKQPYGGTGYNDQVRYFPDFSSRMYFMETGDPEQE